MYSLADFVPFGTTIGGLRYHMSYVPSGSGRMLQIVYPISLRRIEQMQSDGSRLAYNNTFVGKPVAFNEVDIATGQFVPSIQSIRWRQRTFNLNDVYRRMKKLGFNGDLLDQFDLSLDDDGWISLHSRGTGCDGTGYTVSYSGKSFTIRRGKDSSVSTEISTRPSDSTDIGTPSSQGTVDTNTAKTNSTGDIDDSDAGQHQDSVNGNVGETDHSPKVTTSSNGSASYTYFEPVQGTGVLGTSSYKPRYRIYTPEGYYYTDSLTGTAQNATMIPSEKIKREMMAKGEIDSSNGVSGSYSSSSSGGSSSNPSSYHSGLTYGNSGSSSISWGSGQTSQTVTTSSGSVHTIYH